MNTTGAKRKYASTTGGRGGKRRRTERSAKSPYGVEEFLRLHKDNLDFERFRKCRVGLCEGARVVAVKDGVTVDSRLAAWSRRWTKLSQTVLSWPAPRDSDMPWFRTEAERAQYGPSMA